MGRISFINTHTHESWCCSRHTGSGATVSVPRLPKAFFSLFRTFLSIRTPLIPAYLSPNLSPSECEMPGIREIIVRFLREKVPQMERDKWKFSDKI